MARTEEQGAQSISRAIQIINLVASYSVDGLRVVDIAETLKLTRPTAHRIIQSLLAQGWLMRPTGGRRYFLGHGLFELGLTAAPQFKLRDICQPSLNRIARKTRHISFLTIRSGRDAISIARSKGKAIELVPLQIGVHRPLGIGAGSLALLSKLEDEEVEEIVIANARRLRNFGDINTKMLLESVKICRERGFAFHDERLLAGVSGVAVTITDGSGEVLGAISISALQARLSNEELYEIVSKLRREAKIIQGLVGTDIGYAAERVRLLSKT